MIHRLTLALALAVSLLSAAAQTNLMHTFPLWLDGAPGALGTNAVDIPTLTVFLPTNTTAPCAAMVICPGGGYQHLAPHEGKLYAQWLNERGIAGFVLKYRLGTNGYRHPAMLQDVTRALRTVRARAAEWNIDAQRVGVMGSSAGGHLASTLLTHFASGDTNAADVIERADARPDLGVLCYPVISFDEKIMHRGSRNNLLGTNPPPELIAELSNELRVTSNTPPCFIWSTADDKTVPVDNSLRFAAALRAAHVPFALHIYEHGPHGQGLGSKQFEPEKFLPWTHELERWLKERKFIP